MAKNRTMKAEGMTKLITPPRFLFFRFSKFERRDLRLSLTFGTGDKS